MNEHPLLSRPTSLAIYGGIWLVAAIFLAFLLSFSIGLPWQESGLDAGLSCLWYAALALGFWFPARYISAATVRRSHLFATHLLAATTATFIWLLGVRFILLNVFDLSIDWKEFWQTSWPWRFVIGVLIYLIISAFYYLIIYQQRLRHTAVQQAELRTLLREAQLTSLRLQFNPHFLFNSLNSLNALVLENPILASEMIVHLASYLRSAAATDPGSTRTLAAELEWIHHYLELEKMRFGERIEYSETVSAQAARAEVPVMLLQPLYENVFKHAVYESLEPVKIRFMAEHRPDNHLIEVVLGNLYPGEHNQRAGSGTGLVNLEQRLYLIYSGKAEMTVTDQNGWFEVKLQIPQLKKPRKV